MKTLLDVFGTANIGKSTAIKEAYFKLLKKANKNVDIQKARANFPGEIEGEVINYLGKKIGFLGYGDDGANRKKILILIELECDIIVCASRTKGASLYNVGDLAKQHDYQIVYMCPFSYDKSQKHLLPSPDAFKNDLVEINADCIVDFIDKAINY